MIGPKSELPAKTYGATVAVLADVNVICGSVTSISNEKAPSEMGCGARVGQVDVEQCCSTRGNSRTHSPPL